MSNYEVPCGLPEGDPNAAGPSDPLEIAPSSDGTGPGGCDPVVIEAPSLVIKVKVDGDGDDDGEDDEGGFKTPTSADSKIPPLAECPPAPRKRRPVEILDSRTSTKALAKRRRLLLDLAREIQSSSLLTNSAGRETGDPRKVMRHRRAKYEFFFQSHD